MSHLILDTFKQTCNFKITPETAKAINRFVVSYELRDTHARALNSYMLGVYPLHFLRSDRDGFLSTVKESNNHLNSGLKVLHSSLRGNKDAVINSNFKVASDPFNLFIVYLIYCIRNSSLPAKVKTETEFNTLMMLQYKFFTSLVNHRFPYKPNEAVMTAMFESLSGKFDLKTLGTWKKVMENRAETLLAQDSPHYNTFNKMDDDKDVIYVVTDVQSRIRSQINIVTAEYMKAKATQDSVGTYSSIGADAEGEKTIIATSSMFDTVTVEVYNSSLSTSKWIDEQAVRLIAGMFTALVPSAFRSLLINFSELAINQIRAGTQRATEMTSDGVELYLGCEILIENIIQKSFRFCINSGVDINKPLMVLKALRNVYSASRVQDKSILAIRESMQRVLLDLTETRRDATLSAFRIGTLLYIIVMALKHTR